LNPPSLVSKFSSPLKPPINTQELKLDEKINRSLSEIQISRPKTPRVTILNKEPLGCIGVGI